MRPPRQQLAPGAGPPGRPPSAVRGWGQGTKGPPPLPSPSPSGPRADGGRLKRRRPCTPPEEAAAPRGEGAPRPRQAPPVNRPHAPALPAAGQRRTGGTHDGANGAAPSKAALGKTGARTRAGGFPPPPPPPRRTDPLAPDQAAPDAFGRPATPKARVYPGGARRRQQMAGQRPTGRGDGGRWSGPPNPPRPRPRPQLEVHRSDPPPPRSGGDAPPPPEGTATRGGGCGWTCTPRAPTPPAACSRGGRG